MECGIGVGLGCVVVWLGWVYVGLWVGVGVVMNKEKRVGEGGGFGDRV